MRNIALEATAKSIFIKFRGLRGGRKKLYAVYIESALVLVREV
jgi:hypothetical protein